MRGRCSPPETAGIGGDWLKDADAGGEVKADAGSLPTMPTDCEIGGP